MYIGANVLLMLFLMWLASAIGGDDYDSRFKWVMFFLIIQLLGNLAILALANDPGEPGSQLALLL